MCGQNIANGVPHSIKLKFSLNFRFDFFRAADFNLMNNILVQNKFHEPSRTVHIGNVLDPLIYASCCL